MKTLTKILTTSFLILNLAACNQNPKESPTTGEVMEMLAIMLNPTDIPDAVLWAAYANQIDKNYETPTNDTVPGLVGNLNLLWLSNRPDQYSTCVFTKTACLSSHQNIGYHYQQARQNRKKFAAALAMIKASTTVTNSDFKSKTLYLNSLGAQSRGVCDLISDTSKRKGILLAPTINQTVSFMGNTKTFINIISDGVGNLQSIYVDPCKFPEVLNPNFFSGNYKLDTAHLIYSKQGGAPQLNSSQVDYKQQTKTALCFNQIPLVAGPTPGSYQANCGSADENAVLRATYSQAALNQIGALLLNPDSHELPVRNYGY